MTNEELIQLLRSGERGGADDEKMILAAGWIEALLADRRFILDERDKTFALMLARAERLEAKLTMAVDALQLVTDACDEGKLVSLGAGGMTIDAQIRRSVYNQVPAWPIEEARVVLDELRGEQQ